MSVPVSNAVYRALLRWGRAHDKGATPLTLPTAELARVLGAAAALPADAVVGAEGVRRAVRAAWLAPDSGAAGPGPRLDAALFALRHLNAEVAPELRRLAAAAASRRDRAGVLFRVGDVFRHRTYGYTGVITGWDRVCGRDETEWTAVFEDRRPRRGAQPFYWALPDARDCAALFGGPQGRRYVAEESVELVGDLPPAVAGPVGRRGRVEHADLFRFFVGFDAAAGRYVPTQALAADYPGDGGGGGGGSGALEPLPAAVMPQAAGGPAAAAGCAAAAGDPAA